MVDLNAQQIRTGLLKEFPALISDPLLASYCDIGEYLAQGPERIRSALLMLESRMGDRMLRNLGWKGRLWNWVAHHGQRPHDLARRQFANSPDRARRRANNQSNWTKNSAYSHLLTDELSVLEQKSGFALFPGANGHPKAELIFPLNAPGFRQQLDKARPMKDPTIGVDHGEFAHRIQWYALVEDRVVADPVAVYRALAAISWPKAATFGLWDDLLDRQPPGAPELPIGFDFYKADNHDFRCPEALTSWLCADEQQQTFPLLAGFIKGRKQKRVLMYQESLFDDYVARKMFGKGDAELTEDQQQQVAEVMGGGLAQGDPEVVTKEKGVLHPTNQPGRYTPASNSH